jgi:16S rRNA U1498 N3-methylase RsmE
MTSTTTTTTKTTTGMNGGRRVSSRRRGGVGGGYTGRDPSLVAECVVRIREQDTVGDDARPWVIFVPLRKRDRTKFMIEKCTKIVAGRMMPISSDRMMAVGESSSMIMSSVGPPTIRDRVRDRDRDNDDDAVVDAVAVRLDKLEAQSIEASEQCERLDVPMITRCAALLSLNDGGPSSRDGLWTVRDFLSKWCSEWEERGIDADGGMVLTREIPTTTTPTTTTRKRVLLICRERGSGSDGVVPVLRALRENDRVAFLVGPEGGWSAEEEGHFDDVCSEYDDGGENGDSPVRCVSLGASILRAETACMVAVSAWALSKDSR